MIIKDGVGVAPAVALVNPKYPHNVGAAVRAASCFAFEQVWFSGERVGFGTKTKRRSRLPREERMRGYQAVNICQGDYFFDAFSRDVTPVAVDLVRGAESLIEFEHPDLALYVFGPEDGTLGSPVLRHCHRFVSIPMLHCANLASAVYMTLYDRHAKRVRAQLEQPLTLDEQRGWQEPDAMAEAVGVA